MVPGPAPGLDPGLDPGVDAGFLPRDRVAGQQGRAGSGFTSGHAFDTSGPGPSLAQALDAAASPAGGYTNLDDDELIGVLGGWARTEAWAAAGRLAAVAELAARRPAPTRKQAATRGGQPAGWSKFCADEVAVALALSRRSAERMVPLAHDLATRLPLTRQALAEGIIGDYKAQVIAEATRVLGDAAAAGAEAAVVLHQVTGKTPGQIRAAIGRAVIKADPEAARRRREEAEKDRGWSCGARMRGPRRSAGTVCRRMMEDDQAITATAALELKAAGVDGTMDQLRARAYLDALLGQDSRPAPASPQTPSAEATGAEPAATEPASTEATGAEPASAQATDAEPASTEATGAEPAATELAAPSPPARNPPVWRPPVRELPVWRPPARRPRRGGGCGRRGPDAGSPGPAGGNGRAAAWPGTAMRRAIGRAGTARPARTTRAAAAATAAQPGRPAPPGPPGPAGPPAGPPPAAAINLTIPLTTLLGLTSHPGEAAAFGPLDADLARALAAHAAGNPHTTWCLTVTDEHGHPTAHGCAKPDRRGQRRRTSNPGGPPPRNRTGPPGERTGPADPDSSPPRPSSSPPRPSSSPPRPSSSPPGPGSGPPGPGSGPPGGYGTWRLRLPGHTPALTARPEPLAVTDCDHRHQTTAHDPGRILRHLVDIRDGDCTYPPCLRDARRCDFEHAVPWEQGGRTCACNAGPRCRHHHHLKQAAGWTLQQNQPGYHTWTTPARTPLHHRTHHLPHLKAAG